MDSQIGTDAIRAGGSVVVGKQASRNAWVFVWLLFVIFVGIAIISYVWTIDVEEWFRWTVFGVILALSLLGLLMVWKASMAGKNFWKKSKEVLGMGKKCAVNPNAVNSVKYTSQSVNMTPMSANY